MPSSSAPLSLETLRNHDESAVSTALYNASLADLMAAVRYQNQNVRSPLFRELTTGHGDGLSERFGEAAKTLRQCIRSGPLVCRWSQEICTGTTCAKASARPSGLGLKTLYREHHWLYVNRVLKRMTLADVWSPDQIPIQDIVKSLDIKKLPQAVHDELALVANRLVERSKQRKRKKQHVNAAVRKRCKPDPSSVKLVVRVSKDNEQNDRRMPWWRYHTPRQLTGEFTFLVGNIKMNTCTGHWWVAGQFVNTSPLSEYWEQQTSKMTPDEKQAWLRKRGEPIPMRMRDDPKHGFIQVASRCDAQKWSSDKYILAPFAHVDAFLRSPRLTMLVLRLLGTHTDGRC